MRLPLLTLTKPTLHASLMHGTHLAFFKLELDSPKSKTSRIMHEMHA
jgi:hypothetical protein